MNRTLFLLGPSDSEAQNPAIGEPVDGGGTKVTTDLSGVLPILPYVMSDPALSAKSDVVLLGVSKVRWPRNARVNLFNLVGDADSSPNMLRNIQLLANRIQPLRCFNQPGHVFRTSRGRLPKTLANIPGCIVPRVETANPVTFSELREVCVKFNRWPMIMRARGYHGGEHMILLTAVADLEAIEELSWPYSGIFLIEFLDCVNEDGLYNKVRVIMIDGVPYPRHCIYSDRWAIHSGSRVELMDQDIGLCQREERLLAELRDKGLREYAGIFNEIYQRIGLDVFGIDFAMVNGKIVIFEANSCMSFVGDRYGVDNQYEYLDSYVKALRRAIKKLLIRA
jgi:hypothetical protein